MLYRFNLESDDMVGFYIASAFMDKQGQIVMQINTNNIIYIITMSD